VSLARAEDRPASSAEAATLPLGTTLGHLIRRSQQVHTSLWTAEFDGEVTSPQYALLSALAASGDVDQRAVGRLISLDKSTAADIIARLERNGWLARRRDPSDGRRNQLHLTTAARAALRDITPRAARVQNTLLEPLAPADRRRFVAGLAKVAYAGAPPADEGPTAAAGPALALNTTPGHLIRRSEQVHGAHWLRRVGSTLTPPQYGLLSALAWHPAIDQSTAGDLASLDKSSTADVIARLTRRGLIEARRDDHDRRRKLLLLSEQAQTLLTEVTPVVEQVQHDLAAPLADAQAAALVELLHDIAYR
jgi:DNA-binding MarR family transcriptional regulator